MKLCFDKKNYLIVNKQPLAGSTFVNWIKVLLENKFHIDWQFYPKALYVTVMILLTTPLRIIETMSCNKKFEHTAVHKPIFIIGHWRSGTTFFHYLMGNDKNLGYTSTMTTLDPSIFLKYDKLLKKIVANTLPSKRPMDNLEMQADLPYEEEYAIANLNPGSFYHAWYFPKSIEYYFSKYVLYDDVSPQVIDEWKQVYSFFLKKLTYKHNGRQVMLKSLVNTAKIKYILELYPDAKFIHLYRNPYEVYMSTWELYKSILPIFSFQHVDIEEFDTSILHIYKGLYTKFLKEKHLIPPENLVEIRYEDFISSPLQTMQHVYSHLKIPGFENAKPAFQQYIEKHAKYKRNNHMITDDIKNKVYDAWQFCFKEFGYDK